MTSAVILGPRETHVSEKPKARLPNKDWAEEFFVFFVLGPIRHILYE